MGLEWWDILREYLTVGPVQAAVMVLATWRVAVMFYMEAGPKDVFERLRYRSGVYKEEQYRGFWGKQLSCFWCISLWAGAFCALFGLLWWPVLLPLALSGAAMLLSYGGRIVWHEHTQGG